MQKIGARWRGFKTKLTKKIFEKLKAGDDPMSLTSTMELEYGIAPEDWTRFVQSRINPDFETLRKTKQGNQSSQVLLHRTSRKPYAALRCDLVSLILHFYFYKFFPKDKIFVSFYLFFVNCDAIVRI